MFAVVEDLDEQLSIKYGKIIIVVKLSIISFSKLLLAVHVLVLAIPFSVIFIQRFVITYRYFMLHKCCPTFLHSPSFRIVASTFCPFHFTDTSSPTSSFPVIVFLETILL